MDDAPRVRTRARARDGRVRGGGRAHRIAARRAAPRRAFMYVRLSGRGGGSGGLNGDASAKFVGYLKRNFCLYYARQIADGRAIN